jgi:hypothetical protein
MTTQAMPLAVPRCGTVVLVDSWASDARIYSWPVCGRCLHRLFHSLSAAVYGLHRPAWCGMHVLAWSARSYATASISTTATP